MGTTYKDFLLALLALGPKLPRIWEELQAIIAHVQALIGLVVPADATPPAGLPGTLALTTVTTDEADLEAAIAYKLATPTSAFDGSLLRGVLTFLRDNPQLLTFLLSLLKGG